MTPYVPYGFTPNPCRKCGKEMGYDFNGYDGVWCQNNILGGVCWSCETPFFKFVTIVMLFCILGGCAAFVYKLSSYTPKATHREVVETKMQELLSREADE